jgi:hypothetical protein
MNLLCEEARQEMLMAKVVRVRAAETLEDVSDRIVVTQNPSDGLFDTVRWHGNVVAYDHGHWPLVHAIELAVQDAKVSAIPTIYM